MVDNDKELASELLGVSRLLNQVATDLHPSLSTFIVHEIEERRPFELGAVVLASGYNPADETGDAKRVRLATAIELLKVALDIHRLLLLQEEGEGLDRSLVGGTVLAGDYCFSRAAVMAAESENPQVVMIFSELLKSVSEASLRQTFDDGTQFDDEWTLLLTGAAAAGCELAGLTADEREVIDTIVRNLSSLRAGTVDGTRFDGRNPESELLARLPLYQIDRWRLLLMPISSLDLLLQS